MLEYVRSEVLMIAKETDIPAAANLIVPAAISDDEEEEEEEIYGELLSKMRRPDSGQSVRGGPDDGLIQ